MVLEALLSGCGCQIDAQYGGLDVTCISYDSRTVVPGALFIAIRGEHTDGHEYIMQAQTCGAVACVCEHRIDGLEIPQILSGNTRRTLALAYANFYGNPQNKMRIIGITGTNGKSSTAYMLKTILSHSGYRTALIGTIKSMIGESDYAPELDGKAKEHFETMTTPDPDILYRVFSEMADAGVEVVVMEASSHALALEKLAPIHFELGIFTNFSDEHLDFHKTTENYLQAKAKLFSQCSTGIVNIDDPAAERLQKMAACRIVSFGIEKPGDYMAVNIESRGVFGSEYVLRSPNARFKIKTVIPGYFTLYNTLAAATAAREFGIDLLNIQNAIFSLNGICGRLERVNLGFTNTSFSVFIDYAHTPFAMENLLNCVNGFRLPGQRIVTLFGCGGDRDREKRPHMGRIAAQKSDFVIITSDNARMENPASIIRDILSGIPDAANCMVIENRRQAIEYAIENALEGDIILLVGKGHERYEIDSDGIHAFSEAEIAEQAAEQRGL